MPNDARKPHLITVRVGKTIKIGREEIAILGVEGPRVDLCIRTDKHVRIAKSIPVGDNSDDDLKI